MSQLLREVSPASFFEQVLAAPGLTVVKVWADWCVPCKAMAPKIDRLAEQYQGRVQFVSLDAKQYLEFAKGSLKVSSIPALLCYHNGQLKIGYFGAGADLQLKDYLQGSELVRGPENIIELLVEHSRELAEAAA